MTLSPATLAIVGQALFGPSWQKPLAKALGVNVRTVRRWSNSDFDIPDGVWRDLAVLCWGRADKLETLALKLDPKIASKY